MNLNTILFITGLAFLLYYLWFKYVQPEAAKRKNEEVSFEEKPKRKRHIEPERETFEHTQRIETRTSDTYWVDGGTTRWNGGDPNRSPLSELENPDDPKRYYIESIFGQKSIDRIEQQNREIEEAVQVMKDLSAEYEIHEIPDWLMADQPKPSEHPPSSTEMRK